MKTLFGNRIGRIGLGITALGIVAKSALYTVEGGHKAIIFDRFRGIEQQVFGEGTHFIIPWIQRPIIFDTRSNFASVPVTTASKDLQSVSITLRILYRPIPDQLPNIFTSLGENYSQRVLPSITTEVLKSVVGQFNAESLIIERSIISRKIRDALTERAHQFGIILDDISVTHLSFGRKFKVAVEMKQIAQQEAEKARFMVEKADQKKIASIISAEGDAQAAKLLADSFAVAGDGLVELRRIDAAEQIAGELSQSKNIVYLQF